MVFPPYAAPFPDDAAPPVLGAKQRAMITALGQRPGKVRSSTELAAAVDLPILTPRRSDELVSGINAALGDDAVTEVPRRGLRMTPYLDTPTPRSL
jgi:hypothetical protein